MTFDRLVGSIPFLHYNHTRNLGRVNFRIYMYMLNGFDGVALNSDGEWIKHKFYGLHFMGLEQKRTSYDVWWCMLLLLTSTISLNGLLGASIRQANWDLYEINAFVTLEWTYYVWWSTVRKVALRRLFKFKIGTHFGHLEITDKVTHIHHHNSYCPIDIVKSDISYWWGERAESIYI